MFVDRNMTFTALSATDKRERAAPLPLGGTRLLYSTLRVNGAECRIDPFVLNVTDAINS